MEPRIPPRLVFDEMKYLLGIVGGEVLENVSTQHQVVNMVGNFK